MTARLTIICSLTFLLGSAPIFSQKQSDFQVNFNIAKQHLSQRRIVKALPYLQYLHKNDPSNENLKYLMGVCYAEAEIVNPKAIELLKSATSRTSLEYDPNSLEEKRSPVYVFYYLSVVYAQNQKCEKAKIAREKFVEIYPHKDQFYIEESAKWIEKCEKMKSPPKTEDFNSTPEFIPYSSQKLEEKKDTIERLLTEKQDRKSEKKRKNKSNPEKNDILTKRLEYSTSYPLYGVQLGAYREVVPVSRFKDLKNVDAFMDKEGMIRYVVGHFGIHSQAMSLLEVIKQKGYDDAFVVNVNNEKKFADEVVSVNNVNIRASLTGKIEYKIQIGAFQEQIPNKTASMYLRVEGIQEHREGSLTYLTVGKFKTYQEAKAYEQGIKDAGIDDAFVVALNNGKKISLQQAKDFKP
jgi:tetratricopeptide (TPR) repeat protein